MSLVGARRARAGFTQLSRRRIAGRKIRPFVFSGNEITTALRKQGREGEPPEASRGLGLWSETENKVDQAIPDENNGVSLGGDVSATLEVVEDLDAPFSQQVWELNNADGEEEAYVEFDGESENKNVHSGSIWGKVIDGMPKISLNHE